jgi:hypothetical protein
VEGYCVKCKSKREMKNSKQVTMANGKPATEGVCPTCGTKMFKIGAEKEGGRGSGRGAGSGPHVHFRT